jgi:hypothetical protein
MDTTHELQLQPFQITRPEKVQWWFANPSDVFEGLRSKSLKQFVKKMDELLESNGLRWEYQVLSFEQFVAWLPYYRQKMTELGYDIFATEEWYQTKVAEGFIIEGLFVYKGETMVGGGIFTKKPNQEAYFNFKASDRLELSSAENSSLGAFFDYKYLALMHDQKIARISAGKSRNSFGVINSLGYLDYKLRFGYDGFAAEGAEVLDRVQVNEKGIVLFYGWKNQVWQMFAFVPKGQTAHFEQQRFFTTTPFTLVEY